MSSEEEISIPNAMTLSALLNGVAHIIGQAFPYPTWVIVDVISVSGRAGAHRYLEVAERDSSGTVVAKANGMIWSAAANKIIPKFEKDTGVKFGSGIKLMVKAKPVFKPQYGFSVEITEINAQFTVGDLEAKKKEIRQRLIDEALYDKQRAIAFPFDFQHVLVIAPAAAAGLGDFMADSDLLQKHGLCNFYFHHSLFQGEGSAQKIHDTLRNAMIQWKQDHGRWPDAVAVIRGGGAVNDLAWLNDYNLCKLLCNLPCPVFTGIGHERDNTLLDEVANYRFDTPSKVIGAIKETIIQRAKQAKDDFDDVSRLAKLVIQRARAQVESGAAEVLTTAKHVVEVTRSKVQQEEAFVLERGASEVKRTRVQVQASFDAVTSTAQRHVHLTRSKVDGLLREVIAQGPAKTLGRGFAVVRDEQGKALTKASQLKPGQSVTLQLADGSAKSIVGEVIVSEETLKTTIS